MATSRRPSAARFTVGSKYGEIAIAGVIDVLSGTFSTMTPGSKIGSSLMISPFGRKILETPTVEMLTTVRPVSIARNLAKAAC
jgi:hypothetical protein